MKKIVLLLLAAAFTLGTSAQVTSINEDFNACPDSTVNGEHPTGWTTYSVLGDQIWTCFTSFGASYGSPCIQMNGYQTSAGGNNKNEDWLITPKMNLSSVSGNVYFNFFAKYKFPGDTLQVKYSTNYSGSGDPTTATWANLALNNTFVNDTYFFRLFTGDLTPLKTTPLHVAFRYTSTTSDGSRWSLDSVFTSSTIPHYTAGFNEVRSNTMPFTVVGEANSNFIELSFEADDAANFSLDIFDLMGRKVFNREISAREGVNKVSIEDADLRSGMYIISLQHEQFVGRAKVIIQ